MNTVTNHEFQVVLNHVYGDAVTASRIVAGALWLDQVDTDWWSEARFDLEHFDINSPSRCVLGQVVRGECDTGFNVDYYNATYGDVSDYEMQKPLLGDAASKYMVHYDVAKALGFHLLDVERGDWGAQMNRGWYALIAYRQGKDTVNRRYGREDEDEDDEEDENA